MTIPTRVEIQEYANVAFKVARRRIHREFEEKKAQTLRRAQTRNRGSYLPALIKCAAEHVRAMILAWADAYVDAFTRAGLPSDEQTEKDLEMLAQQIAAGSISNVRGYLQLRSKRLRIVEPRLNLPWHLEIDRAMEAAIDEGVLNLRRQRLESPAVRIHSAIRQTEHLKSSKAVGSRGKTGGRPSAVAVIGEKVKELRDDLSQPTFARRTKLSIDVIQRAEAGKATQRTIQKLCKFAKSKGLLLTAESLIKNTPRKAAKT